ncbi:MAG: hypothetical protein AAFY06_10560, partial [Pseudomonadota bacterium]
TIRDGVKTEYTALQDGLVVYMGARDGTVSEYRVTLDQMGTPADASDDVLFVEKDGGPRRTFTVDEVLFDDGSGDIAVFYEAANGDEFYLGTDISDSFAPDLDSDGLETSFTFNASGPGPTIRAFGGGGLETAVGDLPDRAVYRGEYALFAAEGGFEILGGSAIEVDFATSRVTGTHSGDLDSGRVTGAFDGSVSGARVGGTMSVTGDATGTLEFGGMVIGEGGDRMVLGIGGTVNEGGTDHAIGGNSNLFVLPD